jgi:hypothetical protein
MEKQKLYARRPSTLTAPANWMTGTEGFRAVNGNLVMFVLLHDGSVELLSDLVVKTEVREDPLERLLGTP